MWNALTERWLLCLLAVEGVGSVRPTEAPAAADASRDAAPPAVDEDPAASFRSADTVGKRSVNSGRVPSNKSIADHTLDFFNATSEKMSSGGSSIGGAISSKSTSMAEGVDNVSGKARDGVNVGAETIGTVVGGGARVAAKGVAGIFGFIGSLIGAVAKVIWSVVKGVFSVIGSIFSGLWTGLKEGVTGKNTNPPKEDKADAGPEDAKQAATVNDKQRQIIKRVANDIDITAAQLIEAAARRDAKAAGDAARRAAVQNQDLHRLIKAMEEKGYQETAEYKRLRLLEATLQKTIELQKTLNGLDNAAPGDQDRARLRLQEIDKLLDGAEHDDLAKTPEFSRLLSMQTLIKEGLAPKPTQVAPPPAERPAPPVETPVAPPPTARQPAPPAAEEPLARVTASGVTDVPPPPEKVMPARPSYKAADGVDAPASTGRFAGLKLPASMPWDQLNESDVRDFIGDVLKTPEAANFRAAFPAAVKRYEAMVPPEAPATPAPAASEPTPAPADPSPTPASGTIKHQLAKGETLKTLARRYYQDEDKWTAIYEANKEKLGAWQKRHQDLLDRYNAKFNTTQFPNPFLYPTGMIIEVPADK